MTKKKHYDLITKETAAERTMNITETRTLTIQDLTDLCVDQGWFGNTRKIVFGSDFLAICLTMKETV